MLYPVVAYTFFKLIRQRVKVVYVGNVAFVRSKFQRTNGVEDFHAVESMESQVVVSIHKDRETESPRWIGNARNGLNIPGSTFNCNNTDSGTTNGEMSFNEDSGLFVKALRNDWALDEVSGEDIT